MIEIIKLVLVNFYVIAGILSIGFLTTLWLDTIHRKINAEKYSPKLSTIAFYTITVLISIIQIIIYYFVI